MSFRQAVQRIPDLCDAWMPGLSALRARDRQHIAPSDPRAVKGSVDVDASLRRRHPNAHRWDFAIGYRHTNRTRDCVYWVEVHTANDMEVGVVLAKLDWLRNWLANDGRLLNNLERDFVWVSSGATTFTLSAPQLKLFAQLGLRQTGRVLRIPPARKA